MLGHGQMEESQAGTENGPAFHTSGQGFQPRSLSLGVKVARGVEEKSKEVEAREKVTRGRTGKRTDGERGEPEDTIHLGTRDGGKERVVGMFHAETPPALWATPSVPNCPKPKPRTSPCMPCVRTLQITCMVLSGLTERAHTAPGGP